MNIRQTAIPRRVLSLALCAAMALTLLPLPTPAEGICGHHPEHTADCGYKAAVEGQDCAHSHDSLCGYQEASPCTHGHDESCGYREASACAHRHTEECGENGESCTHQHDEACGYQEASPCTHSHDESCGYREARDCTHAHDDTCGYVEAVTGSPCTYRCEICAQQASQQQNRQDLCTHGNESAACETCASEKKVTEVQALINALPETVTEETREAAQSALSAVEEAKAALTEAEQEKLDLTRYTALKALLAEPEAVDTGKVLTDWEWVDDYELIDPETGLAHLPFASAENIAYYDAVIEVLPAAITANEEELTLGGWLCEDYPMESGAYEGEYVFETTLPEGYVLADDTNVLRLTVVLGDPEGADVAWYSEYSAPNQGTHTINGKSYSDVYELSSADHLFWFTEKVNTGIDTDANIRAVLMNDITVPEGKAWTPIGGKVTNYGVSSFIGRFDGHGHVIRGLKNTDDGDYQSVGLFGQVGSAEIVNVGIENSTFTAGGSGHCGSLIGYAAGSGNGDATVINCYSTAAVNCNLTGANVGGLVGKAAKLTIQNCYFAGTVTGTGANTGSMIGYGGDLTARNCYYDTNKCSLLGCGGSGSEYIVGKTTAQFQSGEVAYTLCNGASIWGQNLAGGEFYPKLYQEPHNYKVYGGSQYHNHTDGSQSACLICGGLKPVNGEYQISTKDQLYWFAALVNGTDGLTKDSSAKGVLTADIQVDSGWTPIGSSGFTGSFHGQNHTVTIPAGKSLFATIGSGATVSKVSVSGGNLCTSNAGTIANCCVSGTGSVKLCGSNSGTIQHCYAAGGSGTTLASGGTITNCYVKAGTSESAVSGTGITQGDFQSGKVAYLLNQDGCWGQTVNSDSLPKLGGKQVFFKEGGSPEYHNHNGYCNICLKRPLNSSGTSGNWQISNVDELYWYAKLINGELKDTTNYSKNAVLTADITVNTGVLNPDGTLNESGKDSLVKWVPIGNDSKNSNTVTFDGQGHTISGLYVDHWLAGLFGYLYKSTIRNVIISDSYFSGSHVGGVCGQMAASTITNCFSSSMITGDTGVGGICGSMHGVDSDTISNCASSGRVIYKGNYNGGGVCGSFGANDQISNCYYNKDFLDVNGNAGSDSASATAKTTKEFASGEVAYLLNGSTNAGTWKQNLDTGTRDETPNFSGAAVYQATSGACTPGYTNNANGAKNHVFENHVCVFCDKRDQDPVRVSGITANSKTYDGRTSANLNCNSAVLTNTVTGKTVTGVTVSATGTFDKANVGTWNVTISNLKLTGADAGKYYLAESGQQTTATATINPKDITVTITPGGGTYGNVTAATAKLNNVVSGDTILVTLTYSGPANDGTVYNSTTVPTQAGTYTVTASINNSNYNLTGNTKADFKIEKATVTTPTIPSKEYTGQPLTADVPASDLYTVETNKGGTDVNVSGYPVELQLKDVKNYQWDHAGGRTIFRITQAVNNWTVDPAITGWTYGERASDPTMGSAKFGTAQVTYLKDETVLDAVPANAGSYTARFSVAETDNYDGLTMDVPFTISPKPVTVSGITAENKTYDGNTTATLNYAGVTFTGKLDRDSLTVKGTGTFADANAAENKTVDISGLTLGGDSKNNYTLAANGQQTTATATITSKSLSGDDITVTATNPTYNGAQQSPTVAVTYGEITLVENTDYTLTGNAETNAGSYTLTVTGKGNYSGDTTKDWKIDKASITPVVSLGDTVYGDPLSPSVSGNPGKGVVTYTYYSDAACETVVTPENVGTYYVKATVAETDNYQGATTANGVSFRITQKPVTVSGITAGDKPYDGNTTATLNYDGVTFTGKLEGDSLTVTAIGTFESANAAENKTVTISGLTLGGDSKDNYVLADDGQQATATATITKANASATKAPEDAKSLYSGGNVPLVIAGDVQGGTMNYSLDGETWGAEIPTATEWGKYTVYFKVVGDNNHNGTEAQLLTAEIVPFEIATQPADMEIEYGTTTELAVILNHKADVSGITYQWCLVTEEDGREIYTPLEGETGSSLTLTKPNAGTYVYGCIVTCGDDYSVTSDRATVTVTAVQKPLPSTSDLPSVLWAEGGEMPLVGDSVDLKSPSSFLLTSYTYNGASTDVHQNYPTGMEVYSVGTNDQGQTTVAPVAELNHLLRYSGCSIRITGKPGIRMITSLTKEAKAALKKGELAGYTLEEYGTVAVWSSDLDNQPLTLKTKKSRSNYAYKRGVSDPVFANVGALTQYTNVLVWDSLEAKKYDEDIVMRPYIKLINKAGETVVLYGGTVSRSIGYVAQQNANTFSKGTAGYKYVHEIIDKVNALHSSTETNTTGG